MSDKIKNILQEKFEDFEPTPTKDLWAGIEAEIQPKRRVGAMWWYAAAAIAVMIAFIYWPQAVESEQAALPIAHAEEVIPQEETPASTQPDVKEDFSISNKEQGLEKSNTYVHSVASRNPKPETRNSKLETNSSSLQQSETQKQTKEVRPEIQLLAAVSPAPIDISLSEAVPAEIALQDAPVEKVVYKNTLLEDISLIELNPESVASFASSTLDELGVRSPIHYEQQKQKELNKKKSRFQLVLGKFSITHTSHKPI